MGTVVLTPQDCLSSPHNRQNNHLSSVRRAKPDKSVSQAVMVPPSASENCVRLDDSGGSPPQDGILPNPCLHGYARALSKRPSFSSKMPSICCTPATRQSAARSISLTVKPNKLSRSVSAILPTPLTSPSPNLEGDGIPMMKGRLPFKVVQGNVPGVFKDDVAHRNSLKKHLDRRHGTYTNAAANLRTVTAKVVDCPQNGWLSKSVHSGADCKEPKTVGARKQKPYERSLSGKGALERDDQQKTQTPSVTILQRPKSEETALELFGKFFRSSEGQEVAHVNDQVECLSKKSEDVLDTSVESKVLQQSSTEGSSDSDDLEDGTCQTPFSCSTDDVLPPVAHKFVEGSSVAAGALKYTVSPTLAPPFVETCGASRGSQKDLLLDSLTEGWAGPSYINSPPPSALPLPRFAGIHMKNGSSATTDMVDDAVSYQAWTPPSALPASRAILSGGRQLCVNSDTVASATKDLRRILNLDVCRV